MPNRKASMKPAAIVAISGVSWPGMAIPRGVATYVLRRRSFSTGISSETKQVMRIFGHQAAA
jgi:hypothetical protein